MSWEAAAGLTGAVLGFVGQERANKQNREMANKQMEFQDKMSRTAHQREVADLRMAGLNPILSANAGASTPGGATATMENSLGSGVSSAIEARRLMKEIAAVDSQTKLNELAGAAQAAAATRDGASAKNIQAQTKLLNSQQKAAEAEAKVREKQSEWDMDSIDYRNWSDMIQRGLGVGNSAKDLLNPIPNFRIPELGKSSQRDKTVRDKLLEKKGTSTEVQKWKNNYMESKQWYNGNKYGKDK